MTDFSTADWNENDSGNVNASPNGVSGSYSPSSVAPIIRAIRGASKRAWVRSNPIYTTTGNGASYTLTYIAGPVSYQKGEIYRVWVHADNTGPATLNINTLGAKAILSAHGKPLIAGQLLAGSVLEVVFDGTSFLLLSNEKSKATVQTSMTINSGSGVSPTLALSPNNVIRAALSSSANGGIAVTLSNADSAIVKSLVVPETGNMTFGGDTIWTSGNDGAGSGLDAGLLGGQDSAYHRNLANSTGTLPNDRLSGSYSFTGLDLSGRIATGDGIYVRYGTTFGRNVGNTTNVNAQGQGYIGVYSSGQVAVEKRTTIGGTATSSIRLDNDTVDGLVHGVGSATHQVWTSGNDGSGSGLDAGLLEGQNAAYFRNLANATGTLANARLAGDYSMSMLQLTNRLEITGSAPNIVLNDSTAGQWGCRMRVDASNIYFDSISDSGAYAEVFRFELDTKNGFANGSSLLTAANHNHLSIGTTAASARSALGLGGLATMDIGGLVYNGGSTSNTNMPVGTIVAFSGSQFDRNEALTIRLHDSASTSYSSSGSGAVMAGTWRAYGRTSSGESLARRTA